VEAAQIDEKNIKEEAVKDPFLPLLLIAPAVIQTLRASRKRALIIKALEAKKAPKQSTEQSRG
jgi:hypothetical protein